MMRVQLFKKAFSWMVIALTFYSAEARGACDTFIKTANGATFALYLQSDNTVWVSGDNSNGQLANGTTGSRSLVRVPVENLTNVIDIAAGLSHALVLLDDGTVWGWGNNTYGQLGMGMLPTVSASPVQALLPNDGRKATSIAAGQYFSLVLLDDGTVWAFGLNNFGQLGNNTTVNQSLPTQVANNFKAKAIAAGEFHSLAIQLSDDVMYGWGNNAGQLGDGTNTPRMVPTVTSGSFKAKAIAGGQFHSLAIRLSDDVVFGCGLNSYGQVGDGTTTQRLVLTQTSGSFKAKAVDAAQEASVAIRLSDNTVYAWGNNFDGLLGNGTTAGNSTVPVAVNATNLTGASSISAFWRTAQAIRSSDSTPWGWGFNLNGPLGIGRVSGVETLPAAMIIGPAIITAPATTMGCSEKNVIITFASNLPDTTYSWTIESQDAWVSGATEESDQAYFEQLLSVTQNSVGTVVYTVTPQSNGCLGPSFTMAINVNPLPIVQANPSEETLCSGDFTGIQLESNISGTTFSYTAGQNGVDGAYNGSGDLIQQKLLVTENLPGTVVYTVTPEANGCSGTPITVAVHVNACAPTSPFHLCGKLKKSNGCYFHVLKWTPSTDASVTAYYLYADGELIQTLPANGPYTVTVPYSTKPNGVEYRLVAVNAFAVQSISSRLVLRTEKTCVDNCSPLQHVQKKY